MTHARTVLREGVRDALRAANTLAGDDVLATRVWPTDRENGPSLGVATPNEQSRRIGLGSPLERMVTVEINGHIAADKEKPADERADDLAAQIEAVWLADDTFGGVCARSELTAIEITVVDAQTPIADLTIQIDAVIHDGIPAT